MITTWTSPQPHEIGTHVEEFLEILAGPTWIDIPGKDESRLRVITTLLHGNEPSGIKAIHRWLGKGQVPQTNLAFFIGSVEAALHPTRFTHRFFPGQPDLNRCFAPPYDSTQGKLAEALLEMLQSSKPEAVIDMHNTSSNSAPFAVTFSDTDKLRQLSALMTQNLLLMKKPLGALLEHTRPDLPIITVEFGKGTDPRSDHLAVDLLDKLVNQPQLFTGNSDQVRLLENPIRLELQPGKSVAYSDRPVAEADVTLLHSIDTYNFLQLDRGTIIGWLQGKPEHFLRCQSADARDILRELLSFEAGKIYTSRAMTLSMATTNPVIAASDCLAYLIPTL